MFGTYDRASAQRGLLVYQNVCASCHGLHHLSIRHLAGLGFSEEEVIAIAQGYTITDGPDEYGDMFERPGIPADRFPAPFANEAAARASNGGALPPDLSLIVEARPHGADYIFHFLTGFDEPPAGEEVPDRPVLERVFPRPPAGDAEHAVRRRC